MSSTPWSQVEQAREEREDATEIDPDPLLADPYIAGFVAGFTAAGATFRDPPSPPRPGPISADGSLAYTQDDPVQHDTHDLFPSQLVALPNVAETEPQGYKLSSEFASALLAADRFHPFNDGALFNAWDPIATTTSENTTSSIPPQFLVQNPPSAKSNGLQHDASAEIDRQLSLGSLGVDYDEIALGLPAMERQFSSVDDTLQLSLLNPSTPIGAGGFPDAHSSRSRQEHDLFSQAVTLIKSQSNAARRPKQKNIARDTRTSKRAIPGGAVQIIYRAYGSNRSKLSGDSRARTAMTRKLGACKACQKKKQRCNQSSLEKYVPCDRCARLPVSVLPGPCCRIELVDIKLFRLGTAATPSTIQDWILRQESMKDLVLVGDRQDFLEPPRQLAIAHDVTVTTFTVTVSRFQPGEGDATGYIWSDAAGNKNEYKLPPYYISDMAEAAQNMRRYVRTARAEFTGALLTSSNPIVRKTFEEAERYYAISKSGLVAGALMFWSATRMIERFWLICGADLLGTPPMAHDIGPCRRNPHLDAIPVTPMMDTQLDELAIKEVLIPLGAKLLPLLRDRILSKKKENWYEIYLTSFIILHNAERVFGHLEDFGRRYGVTREPMSNDEASLSHGYFHACKTILSYFHFAAGSALPLSLDRITPKTTPLDEQQLSHLRDIKAEMIRQDAELKTLGKKSMYKAELYWCHQLLYPEWKADMPHSGDFLYFTEKDLLVT